MSSNTTAGVGIACAALLAAWVAGPAHAAGRAPLQRPSSMTANDPAADAPQDADAPEGDEALSSARPVEAVEDDGVGRGPVGTTSAAPPPVVHRSSGVSFGPQEASLKASTRTRKRKFDHDGLTGDIRLGTQGCFGTACSDRRHAASPGFRIDGFIGFNFKGWVDVGASGGWGTLGTDVPVGMNALDLYGIDSVALESLSLQLGNPLGFDISTLRVQDAKLRMSRVGPAIRVHFIPRGRFAAYVGTGLGYSMFRGTYSTPGGKLRLDFHGFDVPAQAGFAVHATEHVALGLQFDYIWARYGLVSLKHPDQTFTAPLRVIDDAASLAGAHVQKDLPQYWMLGLMVRARL